MHVPTWKDLITSCHGMMPGIMRVVQLLTVCFFMACSPMFVPPSYGQDAHQVEPYLTSCEAMETNSRRIQYVIANTPFTSRDDVIRQRHQLNAIGTALSTEWSQCAAFQPIADRLRQTIHFLDLALEGKEVAHRKRTLFFHFEGVTPFFQGHVIEQIQQEMYIVEDVFERDLDLDSGTKGILFLITDRQLMDEDIGGAAIGSTIWLPIDYALGNGLSWPEGVRESTVRHEIVHVLMNHTTQHPQRHAYPRAFVEGMALFLAENQILELRRTTRLRLSDDYIGYLRAFNYLEEQAGRRSVLNLIRGMLRGDIEDFFVAYENKAGIPHTEATRTRRNLLRDVPQFLQRDLKIPRQWHPALLVFGTLIVLTIAFTLRLPPQTANASRRNVSAGFLAFIIFSLLTQGRLLQMAYENYLVFLLASSFTALLLRGYPSLRDEDILKKHLEDLGLDEE